MHKSFLISLIIPTRNRQQYAAKCIEYVLSNFDNIQVIVCDNSDCGSLREMINPFLDDVRLKYLFISERISCVDNYETAASLAEGEYFCAIGDDDTILPNIVDVALWMKKNQIDAVKYSTNLNYWWPQKNSSFFDKRRNGCVWCNELLSTVRRFNSFSGVVELLENGCQGYLSLDLVRSYHGLIKTSRLIEAKEKSGRYYGGCSPDIYSAVCLSLLDNILCYEIGFPFTLPGVCSQSTSSDSEKGLHAGDLKCAPQFIGMKGTYNWDIRIPKYYTVQTIWAETAFKAIKNMGFDWMIKEYFCREKLFEEMLLKNPSHAERILKILKEDFGYVNTIPIVRGKNNKGKSKFVKRLLDVFLSKILVRIHCISIEKAVKSVDRFLNRKKNRRIIKTILDNNP